MEQRKFIRNLEQLEQNNVDLKVFWLEKSIEEAREWIKALEDYLECIKNDSPAGTTFEYNLENESADIANCLCYLLEPKVGVLDWERLHFYQDEKQDIAYERGGDT